MVDINLYNEAYLEAKSINEYYREELYSYNENNEIKSKMICHFFSEGGNNIAKAARLIITNDLFKIMNDYYSISIIERFNMTCVVGFQEYKYINKYFIDWDKKLKQYALLMEGCSFCMLFYYDNKVVIFNLGASIIYFKNVNNEEEQITSCTHNLHSNHYNHRKHSNNDEIRRISKFKGWNETKHVMVRDSDKSSYIKDNNIIPKNIEYSFNTMTIYIDSLLLFGVLKSSRGFGHYYYKTNINPYSNSVLCIPECLIFNLTFENITLYIKYPKKNSTFLSTYL